MQARDSLANEIKKVEDKWVTECNWQAKWRKAHKICQCILTSLHAVPCSNNQALPWTQDHGSRRDLPGSLNRILPNTLINKAQALNLNWFSCPCYASWKARFVQQSYLVVLWSVNEVKARQAKRNQSETAAFMGQRCHWMNAQEVQKQAVSSPCWIDWWARGVKNACKHWRLQAATLLPVLVSLKKQ